VQIGVLSALSSPSLLLSAFLGETVAVSYKISLLLTSTLHTLLFATIARIIF
jgi:hypothetical protein